MSVHASLGDKRTYVRWFPILFLVVIATFLNYLDRTAGQAVAGQLINSEFRLTTSQTSWWFLAFGWTYAFAQIPGGIVLDRFGTKWTYCVALIGWSLVTIAFGFVQGFLALF